MSVRPNPDDWSEEWPTEPGRYWFYGYKWKPFTSDMDKPPEMFLVKVRDGGNGVMRVTDGHFLYKAEGGRGLWTPAVLPEIPEFHAEW